MIEPSSSAQDGVEERRGPSASAPHQIADQFEADFDMAALQQRALSGASFTVASQIAKFLVKFASTLILGRLLGPAAFGLVAMVSPIVRFVGAINYLGFNQAIIQRPDISQDQISGLFWISAAISLALSSLVMAAAPLVGFVFHEPDAIGVTLALGALIFVGTLGLIPNALLARKLRFVTLALIDILSVSAGVAAAIVAAMAGFGFWALIVEQAIATFLAAAATWIAANWRPGRFRRGAGTRSLAMFGLNMTGVNLATYFSMTADNMIVGIFAGKVALGLYDRSYNLVVQPLGQLMNPVARLAVPLLCRYTDPDAFRAAYLQMLRLAVVLTAPAMICCAAMPGAVISLLLGAKWAAAAPIFGWISFGGVASPVFAATGWLLTSQGRAREQMHLSILTALMSIAAFAIGITQGVLGVAVLSALCFTLLQTPLMVWRASRTGVVGVRDVVATLAPFGAAGLCAAGVVSALNLFDAPGKLFVAVALSYLLFAGTFLALPGGGDIRRYAFGAVKALSRP